MLSRQIAIALRPKAPDHDEGSGALDEPVDAEAKDRHIAGDDRGCDRDQPLDYVPADGQIPELEGTVDVFCRISALDPRRPWDNRKMRPARC